MNPGFLFLITSVLCSVTVAILLKLARRFDIDIRQAIAVNYVIAALACWLLLGANLSAINNTGTPWGVLIALGILLPTVFVAMGRAVRHVGIVRSDAAQRLSVFIPVVAAFLFFGDTLTARKGAAIAVGLIALLCLLAKTRNPAGVSRAAGVEHPISAGGGSAATAPIASAGNRPATGRFGAAADLAGASPVPIWVWPLAVWLGYGVIDVLFKQVAKSGTAFGNGLLMAFLLAGVVIFAYLLITRVSWRRRDCLAGVVLGVMNFANIYTYIRAHQNLPNDPAVVFSTMNIGVIAVGTLAGAVLFKEHVSRLNVLGLILAVVTIALMAPW
ncbi:EamA family transporter [Schauerella aestuarii]|uniref:EamA family transporter n=1 Tax=Schauerella aestuarii TaxID=2511204 RepID=UPI001371BE80|nr:EamA/RhaT family transporter [Achromobacter aestuarii]MYZ42853.1 EamA/RhaT family transporter [Achromobacter aestuarii]